jgi:NAD(P)-dependent dehydrogenase (short-subunit alcohol dehydrogenase family)
MYTAKVMVNQLIDRKERSAIIVTSSGLGARPVAGCVTYSAAKACSSYMAQALSFELGDKVDVMSWEAGPAGTKMMPPERRAKMHPVGPAVDGMLRDLGRTNLSYGPIRHDYQLSLFMAMPSCFLQNMMFKAMTKSYHADLERIKKEGTPMEEWLVR